MKHLGSYGFKMLQVCKTVKHMFFVGGPECCRGTSWYTMILRSRKHLQIWGDALWLGPFVWTADGTMFEEFHCPEGSNFRQVRITVLCIPAPWIGNLTDQFERT